jgi:hypothetical protein
MTTPELLPAFLAARHPDVARLAISGQAVDPADAALAAASLASLGEQEEANALLARGEADPEAAAFAQHHLAIVDATRGRVAQARRRLGALIRRADRDPGKVGAVFWATLAMARYRLLVGDLKHADKWVETARQFASGVRPAWRAYGELLLEEAAGQTALFLGNAVMGAISLQRADELADELDRVVHLRTIQVTQVTATARMAFDASVGLLELRRLRAQLEQEDAMFGAQNGDVAFAVLDLEIVRQALRLGDREAAEAAFLEATKVIAAAPVGSAGVRRCMATLSLRLSDLRLSAGDAPGALVAAITTLGSIDPEVDKLVHCEVLARRAAAEEALGMNSAAVSRQMLKRLAQRTGWQAPQVVAAPKPAAAASEAHQGLNLRQERLLREWKRDEAMDVHTYRQRYGVSEITACRDLAGMVRLGVARRVGKARATRYLKA